MRTNDNKGYEAFSDHLLSKGYSIASIERNICDVQHFKSWAEAENLPLESTTYNDILHWISKQRKQVQQRTISIRLNSLKHYFKWLEITGQISENPTTQVQVKGVKRKTLYHILDKPALEQLYHNFSIPDPETDPDRNQNWFKTAILTAKRNKVIVGLLVYQGLDSQALSLLREKDLKPREGKIYIPGTRRSNERILTLEAHQVLDCMEYLLTTRKELLALTGKTTDNLLISSGTSNESRSIVSKLIRKLNQQNQHVTSIQQIRTSVITHWLKIHNLRQVQYIAGHRYVSSTEAYLVNDLDDLSEEIEKYHPLG